MAKRVYYNSRQSGPFQSIISLVVMIGFFYLLFSFAAFVFEMLWYVAPVFIIATLIIDHTIITNFGKWVFQKLKTQPLFGILMIVLTGFGLPVVSGYLLGKALLKRKITKMTGEFQKEAGGTDEEFVDYEEIDSEPIELPDLPPRQRAENNNKYDDLFE